MQHKREGYERPDIELVCFEAGDVITTSKTTSNLLEPDLNNIDDPENNENIGG